METRGNPVLFLRVVFASLMSLPQLLFEFGASAQRSHQSNHVRIYVHSRHWFEHLIAIHLVECLFPVQTQQMKLISCTFSEFVDSPYEMHCIGCASVLPKSTLRALKVLVAFLKFGFE